MKTIKSIVCAAPLLLLVGVSPAHAFLNELIGAGVQVGGKLIGAGIDKARDSMRDHEAEAREKEAAQAKQVQAYKDAVAKIEVQTNLTPLQKERAVRQIKKQFEMVEKIQNLEAQAEANRRAQRDRLFTAEGMVGLAGDAAVGAASTRIVLAQADAMVKAGIPQAQTKSALEQADRNMAAQKALDHTREVLEAAGQVVATYVEQPSALPDAPEVVEFSSEIVVEQVAAAQAAAEEGEHNRGTAFDPDLGRPIAFEFVGSDSLQQQWRDKLMALGHQVVDPNQAEVVYRIEGEYWVPDTSLFKGTHQNVATILDDRFSWKPEKKTSGAISVGFNRFLLAAAKAQGGQIPPELQNHNFEAFRQNVLIVVSRTPKEGPTTRFAVEREVRSDQVQAQSMAKDAYEEVSKTLGFN
ncbi:hypothetical protein RZS08_05870 [Arthrospira platensis SPKY1]|nr:hypothetical protein [Arthrospira platensis SPKY1]